MSLLIKTCPIFYCERDIILLRRQQDCLSPESCLGPYKTSTLELFAKIIDGYISFHMRATL